MNFIYDNILMFNKKGVKMERCIEITEKLISGQDYHYALFSDIHIDSPNCQLKLLKSHLRYL